MMMPYSFHEIRIENTNSCGYRCVMCPREKMDRPVGYMSVADFECILDRVGPFEGKVHLHGFGEPLLDRTLIEKIGMLKQRWPKSLSHIFSTLGVRNISFDDLSLSGLNVLYVSLYGFSSMTYKEVHGVDRFEMVKENLQKLKSAIERNQSTLKVFIKIPSIDLSTSLPLSPSHRYKDFLLWVESLGFEIALWPAVHNYGNGRQFNAPQENKLCPVIEGTRRGILNITWDLQVIPCCFDYNATIGFGSLKEKTLEEIFNSNEYFTFVFAHKSQVLDNYPVCKSCDKLEY